MFFLFKFKFCYIYIPVQKNGIVNTLLEKVLLSKLIKELKTYRYFDKYLEIFVNSSIGICIKRISRKLVEAVIW